MTETSRRPWRARLGRSTSVLQTWLRLTAPACAAVVAICLAWNREGGASDAQPSSVPPTRTAEQAREVSPASPFKYKGIASCAAASCHGGADAANPLRSAFLIWAQKDKHARAYEVLFDDQSKQMVKLLAGNESVTPAHQNQLCLSCHAMPSSPDGQVADRHVSIMDGVGCEACHGPADKWLSHHSQADWKVLVGERGERKRDYGMTNTKHDLGERAAICTACHVGSEKAEVNHDLIAAGHPRLNFELSAYLDLMPPHWRQTREQNAPELFSPAQTWAAGQVVTAKAALSQLARRASTSQNWPEFADYDCFACHHDLTNGSWRQYAERDPASGRLGTAAWGTWHLSRLGPLLAEWNPNEAQMFDGAYQELVRELGRPLPDRRLVKQHVDKLGQALNGAQQFVTQSGQPAFDPGRMPQLIERLVLTDKKQGLVEWDRAAQEYLALVPLLQTYDEGGKFKNESRRQQVRAALAAVAVALSYEPGKSSPNDANWRNRTGQLDQLDRIRDLMTQER